VLRAAEQLLLPLHWGHAMADGSLTAAVQAVTEAWIADGVLAAQTLDKFGLLTRRFARFSAAHNVTALAAVDRPLVVKFVAAKGRTRHGVVTDAAVATMHNRRAALRAFFRTARRLRLTIDDPTTDIDVPARQSSAQRPLSDDEAALVRLFSERATPTRHAPTAALLLAGAHTSELGHITVADLDVHTSTVWAHGSGKHQPRTLALDGWSVRVLAERAAHLTRPLPTRIPPPVLCTGAGGSDPHKQARVCVTVREILTRSGLSDDPGSTGRGPARPRVGDSRPAPALPAMGACAAQGPGGGARLPQQGRPRDGPSRLLAHHPPPRRQTSGAKGAAAPTAALAPQLRPAATRRARRQTARGVSGRSHVGSRANSVASTQALGCRTPIRRADSTSWAMAQS
jgi:integrase/recombinase XerC